MQLIRPQGPAELKASTHAGFTLVELLVTISLLGLLMGLAAPSFITWTRNTQVRSVADTLQNGLRLAQAEAVRRNRQVVFSLTNADAINDTLVTAVANGRKWALYTVPVPGETAEFIQAGSLVSVAPNVKTTGPGSVCINAVGRLITNALPGTGVACDAALATYRVEQNGAEEGTDRRLRVSLSLGGQVRMCDADRSLASSPDGCQ